jgi:hypothetical protein
MYREIGSWDFAIQFVLNICSFQNSESQYPDVNLKFLKFLTSLSFLEDYFE